MTTTTGRGRAKFYDTSDTQPITGVARYQVRSFANGASIQIDDGDAVVIDRAGEAIEGPFDKLELSGVAVLRIWHDLGGPLVGTTASQLGTSTLELADVVQAPAAFSDALHPQLAANQARKSLGLQNQGTKPVMVALQAGANIAGGAGSKIVAVLAPGAAAYDGSGGTFSLDGYSGPVWLAGVGGVSDVSIGAL